MKHALPILEYGRRGDHDLRGADPARLYNARSWITAAALMVALVPLGWITLGLPPMGFSPLFRVLSGELFRDRVVPYEAHVFDTLTPFVIRDFFFYFGAIAVPTLLYAAVVGWVSDRGTPAGRRAFAVPAAGICACLLVLLTVPFVWLVQYVRTMGMTHARFNGLACGIGAYALIVAFLWWVVRGRDRRAGRAQRGGVRTTAEAPIDGSSTAPLHE